MRCLICTIILLVMSGGAPLPAQESGPGFRTTLDRHLAAIQSRDLDALLATITDGEELTMISPDGQIFETRQEFVDLHVDWFKDSSWTYQPVVLKTIETGLLSHALVKYVYSSTSEGGEPSTSTSYLALTFANENGSWRLVFDQNTSIQSP